MASPNRDQWLEMWNSIKYIERHIAVNAPFRKELTEEINKIKKYIQDVVGQLPDY